jgi:hypothetical protein
MSDSPRLSQYLIGMDSACRATVRHDLRTWPAPFGAMLSGLKRYEVRVNDRDYRAGDELLLREWDPDTGKYTGRYILASVTYMTPGGSFGLPENLCVMSISVQYWNIGAAA